MVVMVTVMGMAVMVMVMAMAMVTVMMIVMKLIKCHNVYRMQETHSPCTEQNEWRWRPLWPQLQRHTIS